MKPSVIKELTASELSEKLLEHKSNLSKLRLNHAISPIENPMKLKDARKTIARLKTEQRKRELLEVSKNK